MYILRQLPCVNKHLPGSCILLHVLDIMEGPTTFYLVHPRCLCEWSGAVGRTTCITLVISILYSLIDLWASQFPAWCRLRAEVDSGYETKLAAHQHFRLVYLCHWFHGWCKSGVEVLIPWTAWDIQVARQQVKLATSASSIGLSVPINSLFPVQHRPGHEARLSSTPTVLILMRHQLHLDRCHWFASCPASGMKLIGKERQFEDVSVLPNFTLWPASPNVGNNCVDNYPALSHLCWTWVLLVYRLCLMQWHCLMAGRTVWRISWLGRIRHENSRLVGCYAVTLFSSGHQWLEASLLQCCGGWDFVGIMTCRSIHLKAFHTQLLTNIPCIGLCSFVLYWNCMLQYAQLLYAANQWYKKWHQSLVK